MDIWEDSGLNIVAFGAKFFASSFKGSTTFNTRFYVPKDLVELLWVNLKYTKRDQNKVSLAQICFLVAYFQSINQLWKNKNESPLTEPFLVLESLEKERGWVTWGPCSTPFLKGSPTTRFKARAFAFSRNSSYMLSCTNVRDPAQQHCPCSVLK